MCEKKLFCKDLSWRPCNDIWYYSFNITPSKRERAHYIVPENIFDERVCKLGPVVGERLLEGGEARVLLRQVDDELCQILPCQPTFNSSSQSFMLCCSLPCCHWACRVKLMWIYVKSSVAYPFHSDTAPDSRIRFVENGSGSDLK